MVHKIQECEALLATAQDKGEQIATEGSVTDRNTIAEQLTSLKQQLNALRRAVEKRRGEHEDAAAEYQRLSAQFDALVDKLTELEGTIRCRPLLHLLAETVEHGFSRHKALAGDVASLLSASASLFSAVPDGGVLPSTLQERMSEAAFLRDTLPTELTARGAYIEGQLALRTQYDGLILRLNVWLDEAKLRLRPSSSGVDFEHIDKEIEEHFVISLFFYLFQVALQVNVHFSIFFLYRPISMIIHQLKSCWRICGPRLMRSGSPWKPLNRRFWRRKSTTYRNP